MLKFKKAPAPNDRSRLPEQIVSKETKVQQVVDKIIAAPNGEMLACFTYRSANQEDSINVGNSIFGRSGQTFLAMRHDGGMVVAQVQPRGPMDTLRTVEVNKLTKSGDSLALLSQERYIYTGPDGEYALPLERYAYIAQMELDDRYIELADPDIVRDFGRMVSDDLVTPEQMAQVYALRDAARVINPALAQAPTVTTIPQ